VSLILVLLTAAHVTDHLDGHHFLFIPGEDRIIQVEGGFAQLGRATERDEKASSLDVAYYHLERSFVKRLSNCYHPIAKSGIGMLDQTLNGDLYSLAGYPTATSIVESDSCAAEFFAMTGAVPHDRFYRKLEYRRDMHVLTQFNIRRNVMLREAAKSTPNPCGMSGGAIFSWPCSPLPRRSRSASSRAFTIRRSLPAARRIAVKSLSRNHVSVDRAGVLIHCRFKCAGFRIASPLAQGERIEVRG